MFCGSCRVASHWFSAFLALLSLAQCAPAQTQSRLDGSVTDTTGAAIAGASVVARNVATGVNYPAKTNASGVYTLPFLPPSEYELTAEMPGFKKAVRAGLVLETGSAQNVDLRLEVGDVTETVSVIASTPLLETETSTVGQFVERATVANMPLESRRGASLVRLMGNVVYNVENGPEQIPQFTMGGGRSMNQMWHLDGGVVQNMALGVPQLSLNPPAESLQEFRAEVSNYSAEFGRTGNGMIIMTTRSGTNQFHGAGYEFFRNDKLDARTFFAPGKAPLRYNIFGTSIGGPIRKDKTFFFFNYEGSRRRTGTTISDTIVPRPAEVNGDFSARRNFTLIDPVSRQPFAGNVIPASRIDPLGQAFAKLYPAPNVADDITNAPGPNYLANVSDATDQDFFTARVDHSFGVSDRVYGRYSYVHAPQVNSPVFPNAFADFRAGNPDNRNSVYLASWLHNLTPNLINEVRYLHGIRMHIDHASGTGSGENGKLGLKGVDANAFATVIPTGIARLGTNGNQSRIQDPIQTEQLIENLTWIKGKHSFKTGFEYRYSRNKDDFKASFGGNFSFSDRATGSGIASLLLGLVTSAALVSTDIIESRTDYYAGFFQDDWKITPKLTVNAGIRWDLDTPRWEARNHQSGFDPHALNPVSGTPGVVTFAGQDGHSKYAHDFDTNNFAPRLGFAYRAAHDFLIRGAYGIAYNGEYAGAVPFALTNGFGLNGSFSSPDGGFTPAFQFRDGLPAIVREPLTAAFGAVKVGASPRLSPDFFQNNQINGYAQQWNFTVQKELAGNLLIETAYLANVGHHLGGPDVNINMIPLANGRGPTVQSQASRPFPQFNNVTLKSPPWGNSTYHSLNVKLEKRYSNGLNFLANYTWSKFIDDVQGNADLSTNAGAGYTHIELRRLDKAISDNDIRHRVIVSGVYEIPVGRDKHLRIGNSFLNAIAGDWGLGVIAEMRAGSPWGVVEQTDHSNTFAQAQRPNLLRDPTIHGDRSRAAMLTQYFDTSAFADPGTGVFGNAPRNVAYGPGAVNLDLSVHKRWALSERLGLQFRSDFYNLPNHPNFANPVGVRGRSDFGRIVSTLGGSTGREIQLSLRLEF